MGRHHLIIVWWCARRISTIAGGNPMWLRKASQLFWRLYWWSKLVRSFHSLCSASCQSCLFITMPCSAPLTLVPNLKYWKRAVSTFRCFWEFHHLIAVRPPFFPSDLGSKPFTIRRYVESVVTGGLEGFEDTRRILEGSRRELKGVALWRELKDSKDLEGLENGLEVRERLRGFEEVFGFGFLGVLGFLGFWGF